MKISVIRATESFGLARRSRWWATCAQGALVAGRGLRRSGHPLQRRI